MIQTGSRYGMQTMEDSINDLVAAGTVTKEVATEYLKDAAGGAEEMVHVDPNAGAVAGQTEAQAEDTEGEMSF